MTDGPFLDDDGLPILPDLAAKLARIADAVEKIADVLALSAPGEPLEDVLQALHPVVPYSQRDGVDPLAICGRCHRKSWDPDRIGATCSEPTQVVTQFGAALAPCGGTMFHYPQPPLPPQET